MASVHVTGIKTSEFAEGITELYLKVTTDTLETYDWFDAAEIPAGGFQTYADSQLNHYIDAIRVLETQWDAVGGNFSSIDIEGNPITIFIPKKSYVVEKNKIPELVTKESGINKSIRTLGLNRYLPDADRDILRDFYLTASTILQKIQTDATSLQSATLDTNAKVISAVRQVGDATGKLAQGLEKLLNGIKKIIVD
jgi:hypothetical protein